MNKLFMKMRKDLFVTILIMTRAKVIPKFMGPLGRDKRHAGGGGETVNAYCSSERLKKSNHLVN
jgi:hypothetical protein